MGIKLLIFLLITFSISQKMNACSCNKPPIEADFKYSDFVFAGKVLFRENMTVSDSIYSRYNKRTIIKYTLSILESYKNLIKGDTIVVYSAKNEAECGFIFECGKKYIVYTSLDERTSKITENSKLFWVSLCSRTKLFERKEARKLRHLK